ncbi:transposon Ty3-I Gag-Pol polyprotein [Nephila pilipes]|uniref:Transposon Ty3-I Gag-Pol polyprotein n=1 Tax=Nephila pilipes TaxID=299642 RepID=A0A8X6QF23_NEPPI|nr:transposon Ty3-I Gag-Pol polyprotein [Nephila pilipes]
MSENHHKAHFIVCCLKREIRERRGADFLNTFSLAPDLRRKSLIDKSVCINNIFGKLLLKFPKLTKLPDPNNPAKHITVYYINTKRPPVAAKPRRLATDRL